MSFEKLGLNEFILKALAESGYDTPTPVQAEAVPAAIAGRDLLVSSQTGSGKTAAFMLPALQRLSAPSPLAGMEVRGPRVLVLTPTRELAMQVTEACKKYGRHVRNARAVSVVGGMPYPAQNRLLASRYDILVATPGRLIDQMNSRRVNLSGVEMLVLDEADRMLDMGFIEDIETVVAALPKARQTLLFSATLDERIARMTGRLLQDPLRIQIDSATARHKNIEQRLMYADSASHKSRLLDHLLRDTALEQAIVFTATKREADELADALGATGFSAAALHGDMSQGLRNRTLQHLRRGAIRVLVATDVAARGIDVRGISHVINYHLPRSAEDYVHRIGRTGRAGNAGVAISLADRNDARQVKVIERYTRQPIAVHTVPGLEPQMRVFESKPAPRRGGGGRPGGFSSDSRGRSNAERARKDFRPGSRPR